MQASTLIARALRLINVPGRGAILSPDLQADAFGTLQEILDAESVSKFFNPGIRRHFFPGVTSQHIYSYGEGIGNDFDTRDFDDPTITRIEAAYIRVGSTLQNNELVANDRFDDSSAWTANTGWLLVNQQAQASAATGTLEQLVALVIGQVYVVKVDVVVISGDITIDIDTLNSVITGSGLYEFSFTATSTSELLTFTPNVATFFSGTIDNASIRNVNNPERTELVGTGSDYDMDVIDQKRYNKRFSKGTGGRPYQILFSRNFPNAEIRFDNSPSGPSDILVMDVTVNRVALTDVSQQIRMHSDAIGWLRYELADQMAPEYGKELSAASMTKLDTYWNRLFAGNYRRNTLRVDNALQRRRSFDINRGDP